MRSSLLFGLLCCAVFAALGLWAALERQTALQRVKILESELEQQKRVSKPQFPPQTQSDLVGKQQIELQNLLRAEQERKKQFFPPVEEARANYESNVRSVCSAPPPFDYSSPHACSLPKLQVKEFF
jgi:hypothetical protein